MKMDEMILFWRKEKSCTHMLNRQEILKTTTNGNEQALGR